MIQACRGIFLADHLHMNVRTALQLVKINSYGWSYSYLETFGIEATSEPFEPPLPTPLLYNYAHLYTSYSTYTVLQ